jgi:hypothetical protein
MIVFTELPPQEAPKQLTARFAPETLRDHFLAFLNANNQSGFSADDIVSIDGDTIVDLIVSAARLDLVNETKCKMFAKRLKRTSNGAIKHSRALDIVARVFGYQTWSEACFSPEYAEKRLIRNRRNRTSLNLRQLLGITA